MKASTRKRLNRVFKSKSNSKAVARACPRLARETRALATAFAGLNCKQRGELAEMMFMVKASTKLLIVAKPYGESQRYDFIVDTGKRTWRVQVKSSSSTHYRAYTVNAYWKTTHKHLAYLPSKVDFLAVLILGTDIWYLIPVRALGGRLMIRVYPFGGDPRGSRRYEKYREAWNLFHPNKRVPNKQHGSCPHAGRRPTRAHLSRITSELPTTRKLSIGGVICDR